MQTELVKAVINAGVGGTIAALIIFLIYKLTSRLIMELGSKMVAAFEAQAKAIERQSSSMESLTTSIQEFVNRDNSEHREMLVLLKYLAQNHQEHSHVIKKVIDDCPHMKELANEDH